MKIVFLFAAMALAVAAKSSAQVVLSSITVTPAFTALSLGGTQQMTATCTYSDFSDQNCTETASWTSGASTVATVSGGGAVTGTGGGGTRISAALSGATGISSVTVSTASLSAGLTAWWTFDAISGSTATDFSGQADTGILTGGFAQAPGVFSGAVSLDGSTGLMYGSTLLNAPQIFSLSLWFNTTTKSGGKMIGFGNAQTGQSTSFDRHIYMTNSGQVVFGIWPYGIETVQTVNSYNDGNWHHVAATLASNGMSLYMDGALIASMSVYLPPVSAGYWRIGGDNLTGWPSAPNSDYFQGSIDDARVYDRELSSAEVTALFDAGGSLRPPPVTFSVAVSTPANGAVVSGVVDISGTAADGVNIDTVSVSIDGGAYAPAFGVLFWNYAFNTAAVSPGLHTIAVKALDAAGNTASTSLTLNVAGGSSTNTLNVSNFGCVGDDATDDTFCLQNLHAYLLANDGSTVYFPSGTYRYSDNTWLKGIVNVTVYGTNVGLRNSAQPQNWSQMLGLSFGDFFYGNGGVEISGSSIAYASAGATSVTLLRPADAANFSAGNHVFLGGFEQQGPNYPPNMRYFEINTVVSVNPGSGVITLASPLKNSYDPLWFNGPEASPDGPAMILSLNRTGPSPYNVAENIHLSGLTFKAAPFAPSAWNVNDPNGLDLGSVEFAGFLNAECDDCQAYYMAETEGGTATLRNSFIEADEGDKDLDQLFFDSCTLDTFGEATGINTVVITSSTIVYKFQAEPRNLIVQNSDIYSNGLTHNNTFNDDYAGMIAMATGGTGWNPVRRASFINNTFHESAAGYCPQYYPGLLSGPNALSLAPSTILSTFSFTTGATFQDTSNDSTLSALDIGTQIWTDSGTVGKVTAIEYNGTNLTISGNFNAPPRASDVFNYSTLWSVTMSGNQVVGAGGTVVPDLGGWCGQPNGQSYLTSFQSDRTTGVVLTTPVSSVTVSGEISLIGYASDRIAVSSVAVSVDGGPYSVALGSSAWSFPVNTNLLFNGMHTFNVRSAGASGSVSTGSVSVFVSNTALPPGISTPSFINVGVSNLTADWTGSGNLLSPLYTAQISTDNFNTVNASSAVVGLSSVFGSGGAGPVLRPNTTYYLRVQASSGASASAYLNLSPIATLANPPAAGTLPLALSTAIAVAWTPLPLSPSSASAEGYLVQLSSVPDFSTGVVTVTAGPAASSAVAAGLTPLTTYYARVGSINWDGAANFLTLGSTMTNALLAQVSSGTVTGAGLALNLFAASPIVSVSVNVPPGAFAPGTDVSVFDSLLNTGLSSLAGALTNEAAITPLAPQAGVCISASSLCLALGGPQPSAPVSITVAYDPASIPAGQNESRLQLFRYDAASSQWTLVPSQADPAAHTLAASAQHFSLFAPFFVAAASDLSSVQVFPQPWEIGDASSQYWASELSFSNLPAGASLKIFTLNGTLAWSGTASSAGVLDWDGSTRFGRKAASGTYYAVFQSGGQSKTRRVVIIR